MKYLRRLSARSRFGIALLSGGSGALTLVMVAVGMQAGTDGYAPYGISADDATALTGESRELWEADLAIHQTAIAGTPGPRGTPYDPPYETPIPEPTGFVGPNSTMSMGFGNAWYGEFEGQRIALFAGFSRYDETEGMFLVTEGGPAWGPNVITQTFPGSGPLLITGVADGVANIQAVLTGLTYVFDIASMTMSSPAPAALSPTASGSPIGETGTPSPVASTTVVAP
jgi:hypothetical protein